MPESELVRDKKTVPAGVELDAVIAFHLFGWRWFRSTKPQAPWCVLQPPEGQGWKRAPWAPQAFEEVTVLTWKDWDSLDRATNWADCGWFLPDGRMPPQKRGVQPYSTDIAAAWLVVEALSARGYSLALEDWRDSRHGRWMALFTWPDGHDSGALMADTAMLAVCRAALASVPDILT